LIPDEVVGVTLPVPVEAEVVPVDEVAALTQTPPPVALVCEQWLPALVELSMATVAWYARHARVLPEVVEAPKEPTVQVAHEVSHAA